MYTTDTAYRRRPRFTYYGHIVVGIRRRPRYHTYFDFSCPRIRDTVIFLSTYPVRGYQWYPCVARSTMKPYETSWGDVPLSGEVSCEHIFGFLGLKQYVRWLKNRVLVS